MADRSRRPGIAACRRPSTRRDPCHAATGGCTACPPNDFCCPLDSGNQTCCSPGEVCDPASTCVAQCPDGREQCGNVCCRAGERCDSTDNTCTRCPSGTRECGGIECCNPRLGEECCGDGNATGCINTLTDETNCGGCGKTCPEGWRCLGACRNLQNDEKNCGRCQKKCRRGERCREGRCR